MRALVILALLLGVAFAPGQAHAQVKIVIDAGHGGTDPGGVGNNMQEKNIVLDVSKRFKALLEADTADDGGGGKWTALMTRDTDVFVSLTARAQYSNNNNADRFMSIHYNAFSDPAANGTETFAYAEGDSGAQLRNLVQAEMLAAWGLTNRGNKTANFAVLRDTAAPAVLHELAFITNATDAAHLASATERQKAAVAHLRAIQRHYNQAPYLPGGPTPTGDGEISGRVIDSNGPLVGASVALEGGASVVTDAEGKFKLTGAAVGAHNLTASASGHETRVVEVTVAAGVAANITIELSLTGSDPGDDTGDPGSDDGSADGNAAGGCSTGGSTGLGAGLLLALVALRRRRRG